MKNSVKSAASKVSKGLLNGFVMLCVLVIPAIGYSQTGTPTPPGGNATNPDAVPLGGVPFDDKMTLAFLVVAIVFAVVILKRKMAKRRIQNINI